MNLKTHKVIIDIERIKNENTGLHSFCLSLFNGLKNNGKIPTFFYLPKNKTINEKNIITTKWFHKFALFSDQKTIWHSTHQLSKYFPIGNYKLVYTIHDLNFLYTNKPEWKKRKLLIKIQKRINKANFITFISEFTKKEVEKHLDITDKENKVIYNGVELKRFENTAKPKHAPSNKFIFSLGVIAEKKNFHVLLPLIAKTNFTLVVSGQNYDSKYATNLRKIAKELKIENRFVLTGPISNEEKFWYLNNCECFMFPSISEGFGIPPIEAMRLGKPVFLSNKTSLPEIGGHLAYYFENFYTESMLKVFEDGLDDYYKNNRKHEIIEWSNKFTWEKACKEYLEVYSGLID